MPSRALSRVQCAADWEGDTMSNPVAIALIFGLVSVAFALTTYILKTVVSWSDGIVTGCRGGVVVSLRYRKVLLYHFVSSFMVFLVAYQFLTAYALFEVSRKVDDPHIRLLGQFAAAISAFGVFSTLTQGTAWVTHVIAELRQAEAD
jgi:hypothetical protein